MNRKWLKKMADKEDECESISVGGLASDLGMIKPVRLAKARLHIKNDDGEDGNGVGLDVYVDLSTGVCYVDEDGNIPVKRLQIEIWPADGTLEVITTDDNIYHVTKDGCVIK